MILTYMSTSKTNQKRNQFYRDVLEVITEKNVPFMIAGAYALRHHTQIFRDTKDLDLFCKAGDYPRILKVLIELGFKTEITDARWIAKAFKNDHYVDLIFNSVNGICPVEDSWFERASTMELFDAKWPCLSAEDLMWCKIYIQDRTRYDGADVNHIILKCGDVMDWKYILMRMEQHWQLLLSQLINFQFIYPSQQEKVPNWLMDELLQRQADIMALPAALDAVCRGPLVSQTQYETDVREWGFKVITYDKL